ncbi:MAG: glucoamylase family protein [Acholeplasmatales bacterium]|nr:glucoamylase family protein [Acholeplasmatales bacterium]
MKKMMSLLLLICIFGLVGCGSNYNRDKIERVIVNEKTDNIETEMKGSFDYFYLTSNLNEGSAGYGLARDRMSNNDLSSIASTGYALSAWVIGIENGYITFEEGEKIVSGTLDTLLQMDHHHGFFYHFINIRTTIRSGYSEVSVIDTALLALGLIVVGEYFGGDILKKADQLIDSIEWPWYLNETTSQFYMSYSPETDRHSGAWNHYAEQLMMYILSAGSKQYSVGKLPYNVMVTASRLSYKGSTYSTSDSSYNTSEYLYTYNGSLFIYQYSQAYIDFRNIEDENGINWYENSVEATKSQYGFALDNQTKYLSLGPDSWGASAGDGPNGYQAYGLPLAKNYTFDGTVVPYAAVASINYLEEEAILALDNYYSNEFIYGKYGLKSAFNLGVLEGDTYTNPWYSSDYVGIDKGNTLVMLENYVSGYIWALVMRSPHIVRGLKALGFEEK